MLNQLSSSTFLSTSVPLVALANEHRPFQVLPKRPLRKWKRVPVPEMQAWPGCVKNLAGPDLLERARRGDHAAFGELSERCRAPLLGAARRILRDEAEAQDSVQDSLLKAFLNLGRFDGRSTFLTWATRITINCCLMRLRSRRKQNERHIDADVTGEKHKEIECEALNPEQRAARHEENRHLHRAIDALPETLRVAVEIKELQDRSMEETAVLLGISVTAAKSRLSRARGMLRRRLSVKWNRRYDRPANRGEVRAAVRRRSRSSRFALAGSQRAA